MSIDLIIAARERNIGNFAVKRALPYSMRRAVGAFIFLDQMGPHTISPDESADVPPHPHIGLATVTYLYDGVLLHRDSVGSVQEIRAGDVNWMTAGKGIVHSERLPEKIKQSGSTIYGVQTWVALPKDHEDNEPSFQHYPKSALPEWSTGGATFRLIAGDAFGYTSPVKVFSRLFYLDAASESGATLKIDKELFGERAVYVAQGAVETSGKTIDAGHLIVFKNDAPIDLTMSANTRCMWLGGEPLAERRFIWWNFVSSSEEKIEAAKMQWKHQAFPKIEGETEFVPLPEGR